MLRRGKLDEPRRELASLAIFRSAKRQAQLIDDLLDVARIMSGKLRLEQRAVDFGDTVREALQMVQPDADAKRIALVVDEDGSIGPIRADPTRLQQIVWNLLSNAIKFTPEGGSVHLRLRQIGTRAELMLTDTGQGIAPDFLPAIFAPFRQGDASITRSHGGLGLGLSIVKHLVEAHEGTVTARSGGEGLGATFIVQIPAGHTFDDPSELLRPHVSSAQENRNEPSASLAGISVLIVDDDDESREVVAMQLEYSEASVLTARSAAEAYDLLLRKHVDVLLADIAMPDEDGYSLVRRMRASGASALASMPAAALTALAHDEDRARTMQAGFQLHLAKPIDSRVLVAAVAHLANGARLCGT
jgi:CheY-like chemotaxis protein